MGICLHTNSISSKTAVAATIWSVNICWWHSFFSRHCVFPQRARSTLLFHTHLLQFSNELKIYIFIRNNTFINASVHRTQLFSALLFFSHLSRALSRAYLLQPFARHVACNFFPFLFWKKKKMYSTEDVHTKSSTCCCCCCCVCTACSALRKLHTSFAVVVLVFCLSCCCVCVFCLFFSFRFKLCAWIVSA